jgi:hypothetical protein
MIESFRTPQHCDHDFEPDLRGERLSALSSVVLQRLWHYNGLIPHLGSFSAVKKRIHGEKKVTSIGGQDTDRVVAPGGTNKNIKSHQNVLINKGVIYGEEREHGTQNTRLYAKHKTN